jgi:hypothetical protein
MPLLVRKKLVSADCAHTEGPAKTANATHAGATILAMFFILFSRLFLAGLYQSADINPTRQTLFQPAPQTCVTSTGCIRPPAGGLVD